MPKAPSLPTGVSIEAFQVPSNAVGFRVWNESATAVRVRFGAACDAGDAHLGILLPAGSITAPTVYERIFRRNRRGTKDAVYLWQGSGGAISAGVGYEVYMH